MTLGCPPSITCPRCGSTSHHPEDVRQRYCGRCHWWTSDPVLGTPEVLALAEKDGALEPVHNWPRDELLDRALRALELGRYWLQGILK